MCLVMGQFIPALCVYSLHGWGLARLGFSLGGAASTGGVTEVPHWGTQSFVPSSVAQPAGLRGAQGEHGVSHTYNFKLKKQCAVYWRCRASPEREAHKDHITVQAIMQRVYYIYISKCFSKQQPPYEQSRITGSFGVTNDP